MVTKNNFLIKNYNFKCVYYHRINFAALTIILLESYNFR